MNIIRTYVYVDGFNLFYGKLKGSPNKWLNIETLCRLYLQPENEIHKIKYFTAKVKPRKKDPHQANRQQAYIRALETISSVEIIFGHFLSHPVRMPRADGKGTIEVIKTEEKKSDVNLAVNMLHDAYLDRYDLAVLISNDSDLSEPLRIITQEMGKMAGVLNPQKTFSRELGQYTLFMKKIRDGALAQSQFPDTLHDNHGIISKPREW